MSKIAELLNKAKSSFEDWDLKEGTHEIIFMSSDNADYVAIDGKLLQIIRKD